MKKSILVAMAAVSAATVTAQNSVTFNVATLNVDGLPASILGIQINPDGPMADGTTAMGEYFRDNRSDVDVIALQEDFNFHSQLVAGFGEGYSFGTHRGNVTGLSNNTDGLGIVYKKEGKVSVSDELWQGWNDKYGTTSNGSDELIDKGFRYYLLDFGNDMKVDFYIHHMDAETDAKSNAARESNVKQLVKYVIEHDNGRPVIIAGDSNCRYTRDNLQSWVFDEINSTGYLQVRDPWVDFYWYGVAPKLGSSALMTDAFGLQRGEVVDKIWYINSTHAGGVKLTVNAFEADADFHAPEGASYAFADHHPLIATFTIEKTSDPDNVFVPDPEVPIGFYLRNVENDRLLTGGATWGTKSILATYGSVFTLVDSEVEGKKYLSSGTGYLKFDGNEIYVDAATDDGQRVLWDVEEFPDHTYAFTGATANGANSNFMLGGEPKDDGNIFFDSPTHWANGFEEKKIVTSKIMTYHSSQLWELVSEEELTAQLVERASRNNPQDLSYKIIGGKIKRGDNLNNDVWVSSLKAVTHDYTSGIFGTTKNSDVLSVAQVWGTGDWNNSNHVIRYYTAAPNSSSGTNRLEASQWSSEQVIENIPNGVYRFSGEMMRYRIAEDGVFCTINGESVGTIPEFTSEDASKYDITDELNTETISTALFDDLNNVLSNPSATPRFTVSKEFVVRDNTLTIRFEKTEKTQIRTCFAFDNLTLMYYGTEGNDGTRAITLEFPANEYTTVILPFDAEVPEGLGVFRATELTEENVTGEVDGEMQSFDFHLLKLGDPESVIKANYPYVAKYTPATEASKAPRRAGSADAGEASSAMITFTGAPTHNVNRYEDETGILTGVMVDMTVLPGHYPLVSDKYLGGVFNEAEEVTTVPQYRAYVSGLSTSLNHSLIVIGDTSNVGTGVESVATDDAFDNDAPVEYYNLQGVRILNPSQGIFIRRQGNRVEKLVM